MIRPGAQDWFFREIQRAFREGVSPDLLLDILTKYVLIAMGIVALFAVWRYWVAISFHVRRYWNSFRNAELHQKILAHMIDRRLSIGVYVAGEHSRRYVGNAVLVRHERGRLLLRFTSEVPTTVQRVLNKRRVTCFMRPFRAGGRRVNSFSSFVMRLKSKNGYILALQLLTPDQFKSLPRRRHVRLRVRRSGGVRVKVWSEYKKTRFLVTAPDYETLEDAQAQAWRATADPLDISAGGMKIRIRPQRGSPSLGMSSELILELQLLDPREKTFHSFLLLAVVRNIIRPGGGFVALGVEFRALGERLASRSVTWHPVGDGVQPLQDLLESMRSAGRAERESE